MIIFKGSFTKVIEDINITLLTEFAKLKYQEYLISVGRKRGKFVGYKKVENKAISIEL